MAKHGFEKGHKKFGGRQKKVTKQTLWVLESLKEHGVDYTKLLAENLVKANMGDRDALAMVHALAKLAPHIANKPKEVVGLEGVEELVINRFVEPDDKPKA